jgi:hypothetical protein
LIATKFAYFWIGTKFRPFNCSIFRTIFTIMQRAAPRHNILYRQGCGFPYIETGLFVRLFLVFSPLELSENY